MSNLPFYRRKNGNFAVKITVDMRIPPVVRTLLILNVAAYVIDVILQSLGLHITSLFGLYYAGSPYFQLYQLITYMFMHANFWHLFWNMFALWMFGRIMEQAWGGRNFFIYYMVCGLGAALTQEVGQLAGWINPYAMTIGASGAIYGILLAFAMTFPDERLFVIPIPFPIKAKYFVAFYAIIELVEGLGASDQVAHYAHLGGMFFGLFLILYWRKRTRGHHLGSGSFWSTGMGGNTYYESRSDNSRYSGHYDRGEEGFFSRLKSAFGKRKQSGRARMHVNQGPTRGDNSDYAYNARKRAESEEIDHILDKIRKGGYSSLTEEEKKTLFDASRK